MKGNEKKRTNEELVALYQQKNDETALAELIENNEGLVASITYTYIYDNRSRAEELIQEGRIVIWEAACRYRGDGAATFATFLKACLTQRYNRIYNHDHAKKRFDGSAPVSLETLQEIHKDGEIKDRHFTVICGDYNVTELRLLIDQIELTDKEKVIVNIILDGGSNGDCAKTLGVKPSSISYYFRQINKKLLAAGYVG